MKTPTYKPDTWVTFQQGETGGYGRIVGASFNNEGWFYIITGSNADGSHHSVREDEIVQSFQNNSWLSVTTSGGSSASVYQDS